MLTLTQMIVRLVASLVLGGIMGAEREAVGKEAGVRTSMMVAAGAAIFTIIGVDLPYIIAPNNAIDAAVHSPAISVIAGIVTGIGFLGAGTILKSEGHARGLTTAAVIWATAAIGTLAGLGLYEFAAFSTILGAGILYFMRKLDLSRSARRTEK